MPPAFQYNLPMTTPEKTRVLFVCLGNICRSPTAEGLFQHIVAQQKLDGRIEVDSAGTGAWHVGNPPDTRARQAAIARGYDIGHLRARQVAPEDFDRFDYILAMDDDNLRNLKRMQPEGFRGHLGLFLEFADSSDVREVPDPYYGGEEGFDLVLDLVREASEGLLAHIRQHQPG
jgi:protein-tyrosine phosphatase